MVMARLLALTLQVLGGLTALLQLCLQHRAAHLSLQPETLPRCWDLRLCQLGA